MSECHTIEKFTGISVQPNLTGISGFLAAAVIVNHDNNSRFLLEKEWAVLFENFSFLTGYLSVCLCLSCAYCHWTKVVTE